MPLFNYKCMDCESSFEEFVRSSDENVTCPKCKSTRIQKQLPNRVSSSSASTTGSSSCG